MSTKNQIFNPWQSFCRVKYNLISTVNRIHHTIRGDKDQFWSEPQDQSLVSEPVSRLPLHPLRGIHADIMTYPDTGCLRLPSRPHSNLRQDILLSRTQRGAWGLTHSITWLPYICIDNQLYLSNVKKEAVIDISIHCLIPPVACSQLATPLTPPIPIMVILKCNSISSFVNTKAGWQFPTTETKVPPL